MRKALATTLLTLTLSASVAAQERTQWTPFSPPECRCSLLTPVKMTRSVDRPVNSRFIPDTFRLFTGNGRDMTIYSVKWVDYLPGINLDIQRELEQTRDVALKRMVAMLVETTPISLDGNPGIQFTAQSDRGFFTWRIYIVGRRRYEVGVAQMRDADLAADVSKFLGSFELNPAP